MRFYLSVLLLFTSIFITNAQQLPTNQYKINWHAPISSTFSENEVANLLNFSTAHYSFADGFLPRHYQKIDITGNEIGISVKLLNPVYENLSEAEVALIKSPDQLPAEIKLDASLYMAKQQKKGVVSFIPIRKNNTTGKLEKLLSFDLQVVPTSSNALVMRPTHILPQEHSNFRNGKW